VCQLYLKAQKNLKEFLKEPKEGYSESLKTSLSNLRESKKYHKNLRGGITIKETHDVPRVPLGTPKHSKGTPLNFFNYSISYFQTISGLTYVYALNYSLGYR